MLQILKESIEIIKKEGWIVFLKRGINFLKIRLKNFGYRLKRKEAIEEIRNFNSENIDEIWNFAFDKFDGLLRPAQIESEFKELLKIIKERKPKAILEIGTANGGSLFCFCKIAPENATIISIDLPGGKFGGGYPEWKIPIYQAFARKSQKLFLLRGDSHSEKTFQKLKKILNGKSLDFLFIDGDHTYEGVKKDFEMYSTLMQKGGIVAFHDIANPPDDLHKVHQFWNEIKSNYQHQEIIQDLNQLGYGIGILYL